MAAGYPRLRIRMQIAEEIIKSQGKVRKILSDHKIKWEIEQVEFSKKFYLLEQEVMEICCENLLLVHKKQDFNAPFTADDFKKFVDETDSATTWTKAEIFDLETDLLKNLPDLSGHDVLKRNEMNNVVENVLHECASRQLEAISDEIFMVNEEIKETDEPPSKKSKDDNEIVCETALNKKIRRLNCAEAAEKRKTAAAKNDPFKTQEDKWMAELVTAETEQTDSDLLLVRAAEEVERVPNWMGQQGEYDWELEKKEKHVEEVERVGAADNGATWMGQQGENEFELENELREKHAMAELERK